MSVFAPNLDKFASTMFVAPLDTYELEIVSPKLKLVSYKNSKTGEDVTSPVLEILFRIVEGEQTGKEYADKAVTNGFFLDLSREDALNAPLALAMAAHGLQPGIDANDVAFREILAQKDWSVDSSPDNLTLGQGWHDLKGARVKCNLSVEINKKDPNKSYNKFSRFSAA